MFNFKQCDSRMKIVTIVEQWSIYYFDDDFLIQTIFELIIGHRTLLVLHSLSIRRLHQRMTKKDNRADDVHTWSVSHVVITDPTSFSLKVKVDS